MSLPLQTIEMTSAACIAFSGGTFKAHRCLVKDGNIVLVWNDVAKNFTTAHRMPASIQRTMIINNAA